MLVNQFLEDSARRHPDKVALIFQDQRLTYAEIEARANCLANGLLNHGVRQGDRVAVHLSNSVEAVVAIFAILKAGAVFSVINHTTASGYFDPVAVSRPIGKCRQGARLGENDSMALAGILSLQLIHHLFVEDSPGRSIPDIGAVKMCVG